jgi:TnpA family transposase
LAQAIFLNRLGEMRDQKFDNQVYRAWGLNLLVWPVIVRNTRHPA